MKKISKKSNLSRMHSKLGILEWFHKNDFEHVKNTIDDLQTIGITEIRTGLSWADFRDKGGPEWYDWLFSELSKHFHILPCLVYTPPSLGLAPYVMSPPKDPVQFADFTDQVIKRYGKYFDYIELWNEPNNLTFYNVQLDPSWDRFVEMISSAADLVKKSGKKTVLGGLSPMDPLWIAKMAERDLFHNIDVIGLHGYPKTYDTIWNGWTTEIKKIQTTLDLYHVDAEIWITQTGYSTWKHDEQNQVLKFIDALKAPAKKIYWYSLYDLSPFRSSIHGFHSDEREYHFGMKRYNGISKMLFRALTQLAPENLESEKLFSHPVHIKSQQKKGVLITGGAGFIGTNVADRLLANGERVIIYDNLSRSGVESNLKWLQSKYPHVEIMIADVKDYFALKKAVDEAWHVFHFAAQVAVTTSLIFPEFDHEVNVGGTINVLEAIRQSEHKPSLIFTSTNKVYGDLSGLEIRKNDSRYYPENPEYAENGIDESYPLSFHSPYGSSKGSADQYVIDYARSYGLQNVVFRMSCIYGPHQFGTEDQGWVAHFIRQSIQKKKITLYGDGKQVRDILFIEDLVDAFLLARENIKKISGEAFNIGGGPANSVSLLELLDYMSRLDHLKVQVDFDKWRTGDQKYYVSDSRKFMSKTGWQPKFSYMEGTSKLYNWIHQMQEELTAIAV